MGSLLMLLRVLACRARGLCEADVQALLGVLLAVVAEEEDTPQGNKTAEKEKDEEKEKDTAEPAAEVKA